MRKFFSTAGKVTVQLLILLIAGVVLCAFWPLRLRLDVKSHPITDYETARGEMEKIIASEPGNVPQQNRAIVMDHGHRTKDVYVLLHGLTNNPNQFRKFGQMLFDRGANVLIPRMPHHGLADKMNNDQGAFTAQMMLAEASRAVDIAQGYGERVIVAGLSVNGITAAWLGQNRSDIALAVPMAPFFVPKGIPAGLTSPIANILQRAPNQFLWWDPRVKEHIGGGAYPRFATHSISQTMLLGLEVAREAAHEKPKCGKILVITTASDMAVSNARTAEVVMLWKETAPDRISTFEFPEKLHVQHDFIDVSQPFQQVDRVYPLLLETISSHL